MHPQMFWFVVFGYAQRFSGLGVDVGLNLLGVEAGLGADIDIPL